MKLSKKKLGEINSVSLVVELLKQYEDITFVEHHWTDYPPEEWRDDQKNRWDMMFELEERLKREIIEKLK